MLPPPDNPGTDQRLQVVLFCGGRGARFLTRELLRHPNVNLTCAVNGYDDGLSTGEVRRLLGRCLGPSDFRKNLNHLAEETRSAPAALPQLLEMRTPEPCTSERGLRILALLRASGVKSDDEFEYGVAQLVSPLPARQAATIRIAVESFQHQLERSSATFEFAGLCLGNVVFGGLALQRQLDFNAAVDDYAGLLGLPSGMVENVTDGADAYLVGVSRQGHLLVDESQIVDASRHTAIQEVRLLRRRWPPDAPREGRPMLELLNQLAAELRPNPRLIQKLERAHLVIYAPGTQHSSLFPSYLTPGVGEAIENNLRAPKILITNLREDAGIAGHSAVDLVEQALYYLRQRNSRTTPGPCLVTHYLLNDPQAEGEAYVPLGMLEGLSDPRLVRIANFEDASAGRHDATKVLRPFLEPFYRAAHPLPMAVILQGTDSPDKVAQSVIEMMAGGLHGGLPPLELFHSARGMMDAGFTSSLPLSIRPVQEFVPEHFEYVILFDSSGAYRGEDVFNLASPLRTGRLDAVWGSRRLSAGDIRHAYRMLHRKTPLRGMVSRAGSHMLSLACLLLNGRYVSDTLSGARAVRARFLMRPEAGLTARNLNHTLLAAILREGGELVEIPVRYFPLSPERSHRTTVSEGLRGLQALAQGRMARTAGRRFAQVVFDMDGVLIDSSPCHARAFQELWSQVGLDRGPDYESIAGRPTWEVVQEFTAVLAPDARQLQEWCSWKQSRARHYLETSDVLYPDSLRCLKRLRGLGCRVSVCTGASRQNALGVLERYGLLRYFASVVTSDDVRKGKPEPDPYAVAMAQCGGAVEETLIVEDSAAGLKSALASGAWAATVRTGLTAESDRFLGAWADLDEVAARVEAPSRKGVPPA